MPNIPSYEELMKQYQRGSPVTIEDWYELQRKQREEEEKRRAKEQRIAGIKETAGAAVQRVSELLPWLFGPTTIPKITEKGVEALTPTVERIEQFTRETPAVAQTWYPFAAGLFGHPELMPEDLATTGNERLDEILKKSGYFTGEVVRNIGLITISSILGGGPIAAKIAANPILSKLPPLLQKAIASLGTATVYETGKTLVTAEPPKPKEVARTAAFFPAATIGGGLASQLIRHAAPGIHPLIEAPVAGATAGLTGGLAAMPFGEGEPIERLKELGSTMLAMAVFQTVQTAGARETWKPKQQFGKSIMKAQKEYGEIIKSIRAGNEKKARALYNQFKKTIDDAIHFGRQAKADFDPEGIRSRMDTYIQEAFRTKGWTMEPKAPPKIASEKPPAAPLGKLPALPEQKPPAPPETIKKPSVIETSMPPLEKPILPPSMPSPDVLKAGDILYNRAGKKFEVFDISDPELTSLKDLETGKVMQTGKGAIGPGKAFIPEAPKIEPEEPKKPVEPEPAPDWKPAVMKQIERTGTAAREGISVKVVTHPSGEGYGVETTVRGDRRLPTEAPMTIEEAQRFALEQLETERKPASAKVHHPEPPVTPAVRELPAEQLGKTVSAKTERGTKVDVQYAVVDSKDLIASHDTALTPNKMFPKDLQPRLRERIASEEQVSRIASHLEPEFLGGSPKVSEGAPVVGPDMVVESGNARIIALKRVYDQNMPGQKTYRNWLQQHAAELGVNPGKVATMKSPVLVRIRRTDVDRVKFVQEANEPAVAVMSAVEQARQDAGKIGTTLLSKFRPSEDGTISSVANRDFIREFIRDVVPPTERGRYIGKDGTLSQDGVRRIQNAVFAKAYEDIQSIEKLAESTDNNVKNITNAMLMAAPRLARIKEGIKRGELHDYDLTKEIVAAANTLSSLREQDRTVDEYLQQTTLFDEALPPLTKDVLRVLNSFARSRKRIVSFFASYADAVEAIGDPRQVKLIDMKNPTKAELFQATINKMEVDPFGPQATIFDRPTERRSPHRKEDRRVPEEEKEIAEEFFVEPSKVKFSRSHTGVPGYDDMIKSPAYFRESKGIEFKIQNISPREYLELTAKMQGTTVEEQRRTVHRPSIEWFKKQIEAGKEIPLSIIDYHRNEQEGRARAIFAEQAGLKTMPVMVVYPKGKPPTITKPAPEPKTLEEVDIEPVDRVPEGISVPKLKYSIELFEMARKLESSARYKKLREATLGRFVRDIVKPEERIEVQSVKDLMTLIHEVGHAFDWRMNLNKYPPSIKIRFPESKHSEKDLRTELKNVSQYIRPIPGGIEQFSAYRRRHNELMADYYTLYFLDPEKAMEMAPGVTAAFTAKLNKNPRLKAMVQELFRQRYETDDDFKVPEIKPIAKDYPLIPKDAELKDEAVKELVKRTDRLMKVKTGEAAYKRHQWKKRLNDEQLEDIGAAVEKIENIKTKKPYAQIMKDMTSEQREVMKEFRFFQENSREELNKFAQALRGPEYIRYLEDYLFHVYEGPAKKIKGFAGKWSRKVPSAAARRLPTLKDAIEAGLKPRTQNVADLYELWARMNWRGAINQRFVKELAKVMSEDGGPVIRKPKEAPPDWPVVDHPAIRRVYARKHKSGAVELWHGGAAVDPEVYKYTRQVFEQPFRGNFIKTVEFAHGMSKKTRLMFSLFFHWSLTESAQATLAKFYNPLRGVVMTGKELKTGKSLFGYRVTRPHIEGLKLLESEEFRRDAKMHGLQVDTIPDLYINRVEQTMLAAEEKTRKIPGLGFLVEKYNRFDEANTHILWERYHPGLKAISYYDLVLKVLQGMPDTASEKEIRQAKEKVAELINDMFGGQEWVSKFWATPRIRQVMQLGTFALDWTLSQINVSSKAITQIKDPTARKVLLGQYWPAMLLSLLGFIALSNYGLNKKWPWENEIGHRTDIDVTNLMHKIPWADKKRRYYIRPGKQVREVLRYFTDPFTAIGNKLAPSVHLVIEQFSGHTAGWGWEMPWTREEMDFYESIPSRVASVFDKFVPFSFRDNNFAFTFPLAKGMGWWRAQRAYEDIIRAQVDPNLYQRLMPFKDADRLKKQIDEAARMNELDPDELFRQANTRVRAKYYADMWEAVEKDNMKKAEHAAAVLLVLGVTPRGLLQSGERRDLEREVQAKAMEIMRRVR